MGRKVRPKNKGLAAGSSATAGSHGRRGLSGEVYGRLLQSVDTRRLLPFRFKALNGSYLLTNDGGDYMFLAPREFEKLVTGELTSREPICSELLRRSFIRTDESLGRLVHRFRSKNEFLGAGPVLHILIPTLRCNQACVYCHASAVGAGERGYDMTIETAKRAVDTAFQAPARNLTIEFQGGEPLLNWPVVEFVVGYSREKAKSDGRGLRLLLVTNLLAMNSEKLAFLVKNEVGICTSLDGPSRVHNRNRGSSHERLKKILTDVMEAYRDSCPARLPSAIVTVTRESLPYPNEIVDEYVTTGFEGIFVRPVNPIGVADRAWPRLGYSVDEYVVFYGKILDRCVEVCRSGRRFSEQSAGILLTKILCDYDPNFLDLRSPCGAGIGQIAYNYNGDVYTCDEGRMLSMMEDESFRMGNVMRESFQDLIDSPAVKAACVASCLESLPTCSLCVYKPYCGVCPVRNYVEHGDIFLKGVGNDWCRTRSLVLDNLFARLKDPASLEIFRTWVK